jgi:hypothetical protein
VAQRVGGVGLGVANAARMCLGFGRMEEEAKSGSRAAPPESGNGKERKRDESAITGPSLGPHTVINRESSEDRLARHDQSEVDAMGKDKRRSVVGKRYGASMAKQAARYGIFLAVLTAVVIGGIILIGKLDTNAHVQNSAPWSKPGVKQIQPKPIQ